MVANELSNLFQEPMLNRTINGSQPLQQLHDAATNPTNVATHAGAGASADAGVIAGASVGTAIFVGLMIAAIAFTISKTRKNRRERDAQKAIDYVKVVIDFIHKAEVNSEVEARGNPSLDFVDIVEINGERKPVTELGRYAFATIMKLAGMEPGRAEEKVSEFAENLLQSLKNQASRRSSQGSEETLMSHQDVSARDALDKIKTVIASAITSFRIPIETGLTNDADKIKEVGDAMSSFAQKMAIEKEKPNWKSEFTDISKSSEYLVLKSDLDKREIDKERASMKQTAPAKMKLWVKDTFGTAKSKLGSAKSKIGDALKRVADRRGKSGGSSKGEDGGRNL